MEITLMVSAPLLLVALIIGLVVSIFQAATQINEADPVLHPQAGRRVRRAGGGRALDAVGHAGLHARSVQRHDSDRHPGQFCKYVTVSEAVRLNG
jgi:hypothetical protein